MSTMRKKSLKPMSVGCQCQLWQHICWMVSKKLPVRKVLLCMSAFPSSNADHLFLMRGKGSRTCWRCSLAGLHCAHCALSSQAGGRPVPRLCWEMQFCSSWLFPQAHDVIKKNNQRLLTKMFGNNFSCTLLWRTTVSFPSGPFKIWHLNYIPF